MEFWLLIKVLVVSIVLSSLYSLGATDIYISASGGFAWGGNCSQPCPLASPCLPDISIAMGDEACDIVFLGGNYGTVSRFDAYQSNSSPMNITFQGQIDNLNFNMNKSAGKFEIYGGVDCVITGSVLRFNASAPLEISNLTFVSTSVEANYNISVVTIVNCTFTTKPPADYFLGCLGTIPTSGQVRVLRTSISTSYMFISSQWNIYLTLDQVQATVDSLIYPAVNTTTSLAIYDSQIEVVNALTSSLVELVFDRSTISGGSTTASFQYDTAILVSFHSSTITGVPIPQILPDQGRLLAVNTTFRNGILDNTNGPYPINITDSLFTSEGLGAVFRLTTFPGYPLTLKNLSVYVSPSQEPYNPFVITGQHTFGPETSITTSHLCLSPRSYISIDYLTVTSSIVNLNTSGTPATIAAATQTSSWHFDSITLDAIVLNTSLLGELHYHATIPEEGIKNMSDTISVSDPPNKLILHWPASTPINQSMWYPIVNGMSAVPTTSLMSDTSLGLGINTRVSDSLLEYQFVTTAPCPQPPAGFRCWSGLWISDGTDGTIMIVEVPPNSGVVQVYGDLNVSALVIFDGFGSSLNVTGCIQTESALVQLSGDQDPALSVPRGPVTLLTQNSDCSKSIKDTSINLKQSDKFCKKLSMSKDPSNTNPSTLTVVFTVNDSKCSANNWRWIVLGTVLGVVLLVVLIAILGWRHRKSVFSPRTK